MEYLITLGIAMCYLLENNRQEIKRTFKGE